MGMSEESPILIPHKKHPEECAWSEYCNNFEIIFFQSNRFPVCNVGNGKEVAKSLMVFNLRKVIHPFRNKKHLRT